MLFVVSACLAGYRCRYDGKYQGFVMIEQFVKQGLALPVCPELLGGLFVPRSPCEFQNGYFLSHEGLDCSHAFYLGAHKAFVLSKQSGCKTAILKARSPSCGIGQIYDGTFSKTLIYQDGIFATLLRKEGFSLYTEENLLCQN